MLIETEDKSTANINLHVSFFRPWSVLISAEHVKVLLTLEGEQKHLGFKKDFLENEMNSIHLISPLVSCQVKIDG